MEIGEFTGNLENPEMFNIDKIKKEIEENVEKSRQLENRRSILYEADRRGITPKPLFLKFSIWLFFGRTTIYYCPNCRAKLQQEIFSFSLWNNSNKKYIHLVCPNEDYESVIEKSWF